MKPTLSIIGLGKLGSVMLAVFASKGYKIVGVDRKKTFVDALNSGQSPVKESGLQELISKHRENFSATLDTRTAVINSSVSFVIVPTPTGSNNCFSNDYVLEAVKEIGLAVKEKSEYHLVVVTSTVMPGSTGGVIRDILEACSGREVGENLGLCYNPEFIALGTVIRDMLWPDVTLIGQSDDKAGSLLEEIYRAVTENSPEFHRMNWVNAEITKIAINTFVTTKISYANMIADICDRISGADVGTVTEAVGADTRIGRRYLTGATAYGGPCFPRDNKAFIALGNSVDARTDLAEATDRINQYQAVRIRSYVSRLVSGETKIAVLGISYKPGTDVTEDSQALELAVELDRSGHTVVLSDPRATPPDLEGGLNNLAFFRDHFQAIEFADVIILVTPWIEYQGIENELSSFENLEKIILDPWKLVNPQHLKNLSRYFRLGSAKNTPVTRDVGI
jgi:UDPglucose 6-dehydrogenase